MRLFLLGCALVIADTIGPGSVLASDNENLEQELMQLERNWCTASVKNDLGALGAIMADDLNLGLVERQDIEQGAGVDRHS
jgi:hypothetical protein